MKNSETENNKFEEVAIPKSEDISVLLSDTSKLKKCKCSYHKRFTVFEKDINVLNKISNENYEFAIMSSNAYSSKKLQIDIPGWKRTKIIIVRKHGFSADIYLSDDDKRVVVAFRGTDNINLKDWAYGNINLNTKGQYTDADNLFKEVILQYPGKTIITTGHSLGGGIAIHISLLNKDVNAVAFHPSPRLFVDGNYDTYDNDVTIIYETGEVLTPIRDLFTTLKKIKYREYRYNFIGGIFIKEHNIQSFARCMYASIYKKESHYDTHCRKNTFFLKTKELMENVSHYSNNLFK